MRTFLYCEAGFVEKDQWLPNSWVNVECPTPEDIHYLTNQFNVPESFLSDIADTDERPRIEYEGNWLLTIIRIPVQSQEQDHEETIEALQDRIQTMQADHSRQMAEVERKHRREIADKETKHKEEISFLKTVIAKAAAWFPYFREMLRIENLCRLVGFDERQTATLVKGKPLEYAGELYSEEHERKFTTEKAWFQVVKDPTDGTKLVLAIDRKPIAEWFKEQFDKLRQSIRRPIQPQRKSRGI